MRAVELGSGWFPMAPFILICLGAREVHTFDTNEHYSSGRIAAAARAFMSWRPEFADSPVLREAARTSRLPGSIHYHSKTDIREAAAEVSAADLAFSRAVLEHIPQDVIRGIHRSSLRWMAADSCWIHLISPSDHRAYSDHHLHLADFLRYSYEDWNRLSGNRFAYHNRLRRSQFRELFQEAGWSIRVDQADISPKAMKTLGRVPLHDDFQNFEPEDLVAGSLWFVLVKGQETKGNL